MALVFDHRVEKRLGRVINRRVKGTFGRQLTKNPDWKLNVVGAPQCRHQCCPDGAVTDEIAMTEAEWAQHNAIVVDKEKPTDDPGLPLVSPPFVHAAGKNLEGLKAS